MIHLCRKSVEKVHARKRALHYTCPELQGRLDAEVQASQSTKEDARAKHCDHNHCCHRRLLITSTLSSS
ncbi:hypothetical protein Q7C36_013408 [Tachysurus vachellii]|uniref:Uncharacterized protein n=1 Tax=Tachysurus vachellii TaxID=175792 RepID=A0AA88MHZ0_TACVA|nr:hypothetical protein Q7C36_013408 [Tachysurus vachellii]